MEKRWSTSQMIIEQHERWCAQMEIILMSLRNKAFHFLILSVSLTCFRKIIWRLSASVYQHGICSRKFYHRVIEQGVHSSGVGSLHVGLACSLAGGHPKQSVLSPRVAVSSYVVWFAWSFTAQTFCLFSNYRREVRGILAVEHCL